MDYKRTKKQVLHSKKINTILKEIRKAKYEVARLELDL